MQDIMYNILQHYRLLIKTFIVFTLSRLRIKQLAYINNKK